MLRRVSAAVRRRLRRSHKYLAQRRAPAAEPATPVFVVGAQRSGTNMFMQTVDRSPEIYSYNEHERAAFREFRLRAPELIERLVRDSSARAVVFKPLCDSHLTDRLLERHARSRAVWIYRRYPDVVNSALKMWGGNERAIRWIAEGRWQDLDWRGERLAPEAIELVQHQHREGLSAAESTALFWYLRTGFYFELGLDRSPRVLLARYEDLVGDPRASFARCFRFFGCELEPEQVAHVVTTSVGRRAPPRLKPEIERLCEQRMQEFDACYARSLAGDSTTPRRDERGST